MNTWILLIAFSSSGSALSNGAVVSPAVIDGFSSEKKCMEAKLIIDEAYNHRAFKGNYAQRSFECVSVQK